MTEVVKGPWGGKRAKPTIHGLSLREVEILRLIGRGLSNPQIANALFRSPLTIEGHTSRIFKKLGVASRTEAVVAFNSRAAARLAVELEAAVIGPHGRTGIVPLELVDRVIKYLREQ